MKKVVIIGATGFMGGALARYLAKKNIEVYAVLRKCDMEMFYDRRDIIPMTAELDDTEQISALLDKIRPDVLYNFAWHGVTAELKNDFDAQLTNISMYINVLKAAKNRCGKVIIPGSASEYAYCGETIDGTNSPAPGDAYASVKSALQTICREYAEKESIPLCWLLIGSVYGPGRMDNNLITYAIQSFINREETAFTPLEQMWDYIYVDDLLQALYLVGENGKAGTVYPVGRGEARHLFEYVNIIRDIVAPGITVGIGRLPYKNGKYPDNSVLDISKLKEDTGFSPKVSFEEGILKTVEFIKQQRK